MAKSDLVLTDEDLELRASSVRCTADSLRLISPKAVGGIVAGKERTALRHRPAHANGQSDNLALGTDGSYPGGVWLPWDTWLEGTADNPLTFIATKLSSKGAVLQPAELNAVRLIDVINGTRAAIAVLQAKVDELELVVLDTRVDNAQLRSRLDEHLKVK